MKYKYIGTGELSIPGLDPIKTNGVFTLNDLQEKYSGVQVLVKQQKIVDDDNYLLTVDNDKIVRLTDGEGNWLKIESNDIIVKPIKQSVKVNGVKPIK